MNQERLTRLTREILAHGLDGIALVPGPNMLYLTGIHAHLSERPIVLIIPADDDPAIIIPSLEASKARAAEIPETRIFTWSDEEGYKIAFQRACAQLELSDYLLGVEALHMRVLELELLNRYAPGVATAHAEPLLANLRMVKDDGELEAMKRAAIVAESAMESLLSQIRLGMTEKEIASRLTQELLLAGAEALAFAPIVSAGPNSASPHAVPTERPLQSGDMVVIDWGALVDDYPSDITRTFAAGQVNAELGAIYEAVKAANEQGREAAQPGVTGEAIDRTVRTVIREAGYGDYFIHRTGHGLGLEIHEPPFIVEGSKSPLEVGTVFTVEPGIYLPGLGGVRIEDNVVITENGYRSLTTLTRELVQIG